VQKVRNYFELLPKELTNTEKDIGPLVDTIECIKSYYFEYYSNIRKGIINPFIESNVKNNLHLI